MTYFEVRSNAKQISRQYQLLEEMGIICQDVKLVKSQVYEEIRSFV